MSKESDLIAKFVSHEESYFEHYNLIKKIIRKSGSRYIRYIP